MFALCVMLAGYVIAEPEDSALRYVVEYRTPFDHVTVEPRPASCDFLHAPIGVKSCAKTVSVVLRAHDAKAQPLISVDDGTTWRWNDDGYADGTYVAVKWLAAERY